ncbi:uncharacterized protein LAESUDRAFT_727653 [Laetiporus sulphureus 93-53]|uniref:GIT Spa2 homology (SHD) domain-containing protein n=1 Tax=Laetiporus sulphureus 93-53 TaxID=1314785 RepID=A0A165DFQ2_9APHY|nr:uncharacterized protein LAESUDRAFT_727653 [Laetiporus sulphureus 93-53]KZT04794.1 hypothetical protein LAESUDRAFT_727653 [Laetiporus sulphureus 93-53]
MMNRPGPSRAASPTNTTYSGISNYRTDSYRPMPRDSPPPEKLLDSHSIARTHFEELSKYLASYLAKEPAHSRSTARQKLTRLTRQQFQELSTDVYDELMRRRNNTTENEIPFLPVRDDFHPKRNQARQKLATLPTGRFKDLSSDVYYELSRRYPEFKEDSVVGADVKSPGSIYDDYPSPDFPTSPRSKPMATTALPSALRAPDDRAIDSGYGPSPSSARRPSEDNYNRRRPSQDDYAQRRRPSQDMYRQGDRRRPSQDTTARRSEDRRRPSESSESNAQSATAGMGMIIPNKSTIAEEDIEVPYGRESTAMDDRTHASDDEDDERRGLSGLSARLQAVEGEEEARSGDDYFDKMSFGRASVTSDRSARGLNGRTSVAGEEQERMRRDYEYKVATMQKRITMLERDLEDVQQREKRWTAGEERVQNVEEELRELQQGMAKGREAEAKRTQEDEEELKVLRERCERLESERVQAGQGNSEILDQLRSDMEALMVELTDLSHRNDNLMTAKDSNLAVIRDLDAQLKGYKRKYEQAKTELRSVKATSQLFLQTPKIDDQLPVSPDGGLLDIHVTAFVSAVDSLLTAGRSNSPTRVLTPMKAVVNAVASIIDDVKAFECRMPSERADIDMDALRALRDRADATLSNLVTATKTHATSSGMSPVSLLDAAASHVSLTVTEIGKAVCIRKATKAEQEQFNLGPSVAGVTLRSVDEIRAAHQREGSSASASSKRSEVLSSSERQQSFSYVSSGLSMLDQRRSPPSNLSSSEASSPPPIFDQPNGRIGVALNSDESMTTENLEDAWTELKPYLEAQTESIIYAIQSVLSGVRSPTPSPTLNENLTQIITIVSSIVAVCKDNLPPASATQGEAILAELGEHANKLSEVQALPEVTKESRQVMAKSSFAVANAMKGLMKL